MRVYRNINVRFDETDPGLRAPMLIVSYFCVNKNVKKGRKKDPTTKELDEGMKRFTNAIIEEMIGRATGEFFKEYNLDTIV